MAVRGTHRSRLRGLLRLSGARPLAPPLTSLANRFGFGLPGYLKIAARALLLEPKRTERERYGR